MEISYPEIALIVGLVIALFKLVEKGGYLLYKFFTKTTDKGKIDNEQEIDIALLKQRLDLVFTNHLPHIQAALEKNVTEHTDIKIILTAIATKQGIDVGKLLSR